MDKIKVLRGYYPILGISSVLVLLIVGLLSVFSLQDKISLNMGKVHDQQS